MTRPVKTHICLGEGGCLPLRSFLIQHMHNVYCSGEGGAKIAESRLLCFVGGVTGQPRCAVS